MSETQPVTESVPRPPADGLSRCTETHPCPTDVLEKITVYVREDHGLVPDFPDGWGKGVGFGFVHARLHAIAERAARVDPETFSWRSVWAQTKLDLSQLARDLRSEEKGLSWEYEEGRWILWRPDGISMRSELGRQPVTLPVLSGYLRPTRRVTVEGWTYFEVLVSQSQKVTASAEDLLKRLERDGRIRKRKLGHDVLVETLQKMAPDSGVAYPTYGVHARPNGALEICTSPVPIRDEQLSAHQEIAVGFDYRPNPDDFRAYAEFLRFYHPYETAPAMALAAIAPVAHALRGADLFVPHVWNWSLAHGLGKSLVLLAFSRNLWGRSATTGSAINSEFRLSAHLDAAAVPQTVEECEGLRIHQLSPDLKTSAERPVVTRRGNTMLTMVPYSSRAIFFFSGNRLALKSGPALTRVLAPRFDTGQLEARKARKAELDAVFGRLRPIGHTLSEQLVALHPRLESLVLQVRDHEAAIARTGAAQGDIRRAQMWAVVYVGLEIWAAAFAKHGVDWTCPPIARFVEDVVIPVDQHTFEGEETIVDSFRSWFSMWRVRNVGKVTNAYLGGRHDTEYEHTVEVRGRLEVWKEAELQVEGRTIHGSWVAKGLIDEYNKQAPPDLQINSLRELTVTAAEQYRIPLDLVLGKDGVPRTEPFSARLKPRVALVPDEEL